MKKIIIIPAYNEESNLISLVESINRHAPEFDYVIVNDCSTDKTLEICKKHTLSYVNLDINLGIGGCVQTGYKFAKEYDYDIAVQLDGDGQHNPSYLNEMLNLMTSERCDMIVGSRFINKEGFQSSLARRLGITFLSSLIYLLSNQRIYDVTSGYRMCNKNVIEVFSKNYPKDYPEPESTMTLLRSGLKIKEIPMKMLHRESGVSSITTIRSVYYMIKVSLAIIIDRVK